MNQEVFHHRFANGLTLLAERLDHVRSAAFNFLVPSGSMFDPPQYLGLASGLADLIVRGAGKRNSRELAFALDNLGVDRDESVGSRHLRFWGATLSKNLFPALEIYADILRRPHFPAEELDAVKALALHDIHSLEDEPRRKVIIELRRRHFPDPIGRDRRGTEKGVENLTIDVIRNQHAKHFQPGQMILSVAGNIDWSMLREQVERLFGDWSSADIASSDFSQAQGGKTHLKKETTQTHIAMAYPSVPFGGSEYYLAQGAVQVLSGGMSARLFTEVREKRGLCYSVGASYQSFKEQACVLCYAGTTNERAQETLEVTLDELHRLKDGVTEEEVQRVKAGLKSSLIMQEESTSARAGALASDWYFLGRVRTFDEIQQAVESLTPARIVEHARNYPPEKLTLVTLGPNDLALPERYQTDVSAT